MRLSGAHEVKVCARDFPSALSNVYMYYKRLKKRAHIGRTVPKIVRPMAELCVPGAECTVNFKHCCMCECV